MKKFLFSLILCFFGFFCFSLFNIEAKTVSTDIGDIDFDLSQIKQDNPSLDLSDNYFIAKRSNSNEVILYVSPNNSTAYSMNFIANNPNYFSIFF